MGVFTSANEAPSASSRVSSPSRPDNYLSLRRADDGSVNSAVVCSLRYSPSSGRPAAPASPSPQGYTKRKACCAVVGRAVSHPQNAYCAHLRGQYQQPHPVWKASTVTFSLIFPEAPPISLYRPSRRCHGFCRREALTLPTQCCAVMPPVRVLVLVPAGEHSACRQHRPAAARRPASPFSLPWARSVCTTFAHRNNDRTKVR